MPTLICPNCNIPRELTTVTHARLTRQAARGLPPYCGACVMVLKFAHHPRCVHCKLRAGCRRAGLCQQCFEAPAVRALYPPKNAKYSRHGNGTGKQSHPLPDMPTTAPPGSPEKVAVLEARAKAGTQLFHSLDARAEA